MGADGDSGAATTATATVNIRCSNGTSFSVQTALDSTVGAFKVALAGNCDVPAQQQRLIYKGRILKDGQTLESYGVEPDHTIHVVRTFASSFAEPSISTDNIGTSRATNTNWTSEVTPGYDGGGGFGGAPLGSSLFEGWAGIGASGFFGDGLPGFDQVQLQQLTESPDMMGEIMNDQDLVQSLIMNSSQMREIIDRNPDLAHVLNDPSTLHQALEAARNPELMREMMRNTDRAMSNIESSPEGFNMLRRMYETVQEPLLNTTTMAGDPGSDLVSNPLSHTFASLQENQERTQFGNQSLNPSTTSAEPATMSTAPNTNPLPNPWINTRGTQPMNTTAPNIGRSGGLGLEPPVPSFVNLAMRNPAMQNLLSDPEYVNQMFSSLMESNTQFRDTVQNPEFPRQQPPPEVMQQLHQSILSQSGRQQTSQEQNETGGANTGMQNTGLELLMNMLGGRRANGSGVPSTSDVPPPEVLYATQLSQLQEMGFFDGPANIRALSATAGNVHAAVERLLGNLGR